MPVTQSPLPATLRVGGKVVLGFHVYEYHGLEDFGRAELILGPPGSSAHFGVQRTLKDCVEAVCCSVFGDAVPLLVSLEVGFDAPLDERLLDGKREGGIEAFTRFGHRGKKFTVTFSPNLGAMEVECAGERAWRGLAPLHWYSIGRLRPWYSQTIERAVSDRLVTAHFKEKAHVQSRAPHRMYDHKWRQANGSTVAVGSNSGLGTSRPAWQAWALMGYRLQPGGGAIDRRGEHTPEGCLGQVAARERLPWPVEWRPSAEEMGLFLSPVDAATASAIARKNAAAGKSVCGPPRASKGRPGDVMWLLSEAAPRVALVLGQAAWGGGGPKSGLQLKALPTSAAGGSAGGALPPLLEAAQLTADMIVPINQVVPFAQLLDMEWCRPPVVRIPGDSAPVRGESRTLGASSAAFVSGGGAKAAAAAGPDNFASSSAGGKEPLVPVACGVPVGEGTAVSNALARDGPLPRYAAAVPADAGADTLERAAARQAERLQFAKEVRADRLKSDEAWLAERMPSAEDLAKSAQRAAGPAGSSCTGEPSVCQSLARRLGAHIQADPFANPLLNASAEELERTDAVWGRLCDDRGVWMDPIISRIVGAAPEGRKAGVSQELRGMQIELACAETRPAPPPLRQLVQAMYPYKDDLAACRAWDAHFRSGVPYGMLDVVGRLLAATLELLCREEREQAECALAVDPTAVAGSGSKRKLPIGPAPEPGGSDELPPLSAGKRRRPPEEMDAAPEGKRFPGVPDAGLEAEDAKLLMERDPALVAPRQGHGGEAPPSAAAEPSARVVNKPAETARLTSNKLAAMREPAAGWGSAREGASVDPRGVAASAGDGASGTQRPPPAEDAVRPMPVPDSHRAAVLEGLRRVLQLGHTRKDPAQYWEEKGSRMPEFPFPQELQAMREELGLG